MFFFPQILFQFIPPLPSFTFFFDSALVVKFTISSQKACLINMNHEVYTIEQQIIKSYKNLILYPFKSIWLFQISFVFLKFCFSFKSVLMVRFNLSNQNTCLIN